jgi:uncharacterized membrane protein HdeD (DUF308 family)
VYRVQRRLTRLTSEVLVLVLGVILIIVGFLTGISLLYWLGAILAIVGIVLMFTGGIGGRRVY